LAYLFLGGLNIHTAHHFFPTADQAVHPKILKIIDRVCQQKGVKRFKTNRINCFASLSKGILYRIPFAQK
jgi:fatty acid desaturase